MRFSPRFSIALGLLALGLGCSSGHHKSSAPPSAPADMARDDRGYGAEAAATAESMSAAAPASITPTVTTTPNAVMGSLPPPAAADDADGAAEPAVVDADLPTTGEDAMDQMLVFNGALSMLVQAETIPASIDAAVDFAVRAGGYISQQTDTSLTLRVPSRRFRKLMKQIEGIGDVQSRSVQTMDVSEEFHDLKVRLENLLATRLRIQKLLTQAKTLPEILSVEKELERVGGEIDRIEGRLRFLSSQAAFSTVTIGFAEHAPPVVVVESEPPPPPPPLPPRLLNSPVNWIDSVGVDRLMHRPGSLSVASIDLKRG